MLTTKSRSLFAIMVTVAVLWAGTTDSYAATKRAQRQPVRYGKSSAPVAAKGAAKRVKVSSAQSKSRKKVRVVSRRATTNEQLVPRFAIREVTSPSDLERVTLAGRGTGVQLQALPQLSTSYNGRLAGMTANGQVVYFSADPALQSFVADLTTRASAPHVAIVAMEPATGRILAVSDKSTTIPDLALHAGFPAASLFKVITTTAALERAGIQPNSLVRFRGGNYTLNELNYRFDEQRDRRVMTVAEGLGRSCNPVFARLALNHLNPPILRHYAQLFGFNSRIDFDLPLPQSTADIPTDDFELSRAAAGFGDVYISPVHAAVLMSQLATGGVRQRPVLIDRVMNPNGQLAYHPVPVPERVLRTDTALTVLDMMEATTTIGTSRSEFMRRNQPVLPNIRVAAKTGTLTGSNPTGLNHWFIAAAPIEDPQIAIAIIVVDSRGANAKASRLGRQIIEHYLINKPSGRLS